MTTPFQNLLSQMQLEVEETKTVTIMEEIISERVRQITDEGFEPVWDDKYENFQLARGAACYALGRNDAVIVAMGVDVPVWPWDKEWFKPSDPRRNLIKAAALIVAEIERLDRNVV